MVQSGVLSAAQVTEAMAWAWSENTTQRSGDSSDLADLASASGQTRLRELATDVVERITAPDPQLLAGVDTRVSIEADVTTYRPGESEVWLSLTSPLKHQLTPRSGVFAIDAAFESGAVNQLRWDGERWYAAGTDGRGSVAVAAHFGFDFAAEGTAAPLLCLHGGGGAARSSAAAWAAAGGNIWWAGGRRGLDARGPWSTALIEKEHLAQQNGPRLHIDFDVKPGQPAADAPRDADIILHAAYDSAAPPVGASSLVEADEFHRILDGRWLLAAQHLDAWARLFNAAQRDALPGLALTLTRLVELESRL